MQYAPLKELPLGDVVVSVASQTAGGTDTPFISNCTINNLTLAAVEAAPCFHVNEPSDGAIVQDASQALRNYLNQPTPAQSKGGQGTITVNGQVGHLQFGTSTASDVAAQAGTPDQTAQGNFNPGGGDPNVQALGYNCSIDEAAGGDTFTPQSSTTRLYCSTVYYINADTGTLEAFSTTSSNFSTSNGTRVGLPGSVAEQREQQQAGGGCLSGITTGQSDAATVFLAVNTETGDPAIGPVTSIEAESNQNQVGLFFC